MIIQKSLTIHNGCQHKDVSIEFLPGKTYAITGKNACGKTNMLQLNMYGLLGLVNKSWGSQKDFNRTGTKDGYVEVCIQNTDTGDLLYIRRHFTAGTKNPDRLWYNNTDHEPDIVGRDAVNDVIQGIYGVPCRILFELLYMRQGMTNWLLTAPSTSIYTFMNSIFDTSQFKKIREVLMDAANSIALYEVDHARCAELESKISMLESMVYEDTAPLMKQLEEARSELVRLESATVMSISDKRSALNKLTVERSNAERILKSAKDALQALDTNPVPWITDEHRKFISDFNDVTLRQASLMSEITKAEWGLSTTDADILRVNKLLQDVCTHIKSVEDSMGEFISSDVCPLCMCKVMDKSSFRHNVEHIFAGQSYEDFKAKRDILNKELEQLSESKVTAENNISTLNSALDTLNKFIKDNSDVRDRIDAAIHSYTMWERSRCNRDAFNTSVLSAQANLDSILQRIKELNDTPAIPDNDAIDAGYNIAKVKLNIQALESRISIINTNKTADKARLDSFKAELSSREADRLKNEKNQQMFDRIMRLREGTGNKRIPARYLNDKVDRLNGELEAYCRMANLDVILFLDKDDFVFRFTDGKDVRPTGQLSGAQQTLCSTILQLALVRVVNPRLGVIQMDEPTVFLDPTNRAKLLSLFESLSSVLSSTGTITLVPTHDVDLIGACNDRVEL